MRDTISDGGCRRQRQIDDTHFNAKALGRFLRHKLTDTRNFKRRALDGFGNDVERLAAHIFERAFDDAGAADADVDGTRTFAHAVESARHERVILGNIGKHDELGRAEEAQQAQLAAPIDHEGEERPRRRGRQGEAQDRGFGEEGPAPVLRGQRNGLQLAHGIAEQPRLSPLRRG